MRVGLQPDKNLEDLKLMSSPLQALPLFSNLSYQNQYVTSQWHLWVMDPLAGVCEPPPRQTLPGRCLGPASPPSLQAPGMLIALLTQGDCPTALMRRAAWRHRLSCSPPLCCAGRTTGDVGLEGMNLLQAGRSHPGELPACTQPPRPLSGSLGEGQENGAAPVPCHSHALASTSAVASSCHPALLHAASAAGPLCPPPKLLLLCLAVLCPVPCHLCPHCHPPATTEVTLQHPLFPTLGAGFFPDLPDIAALHLRGNGGGAAPARHFQGSEEP